MSQCCIAIVFLIPIVIQLIFGIRILFKPNVPIKATVNILQEPCYNPRTASDCVMVANFTLGNKTYQGSTCSWCFKKWSNNQTTVYYSIINHDNWDFWRYGSVTIATVLFSTIVFWLVVWGYTAWRLEHPRSHVRPTPEPSETRQPPEIVVHNSTGHQVLTQVASITYGIPMQKVVVGKTEGNKAVVCIENP